MPHKHKRKRDDDVSNFDLAPTNRAKPLPAYNKASIFSKDQASSSNKRRKPSSTKPAKQQDDTPKAFARLMEWQSAGKRPNGLDDGSRKKLKKPRKETKSKPSTTEPQSKSKPTASEKPATQQPKPKSTPAPAPTPKPTSTARNAIPKILPGESLSQYAIRVDQSLPLSTVSRNTNPHLPADLQASLKKQQRTTKHNKRLQRMQADWRTTEAKLAETEAEAEDEREDQKEEDEVLWASVRAARTDQKGKKKRGGKKTDEDDPWKELEKKRREETRQRGLQDVVKAPPELKKVKSKFKTRAEDLQALDGKQMNDDGDVLVDVGDVPTAVGSLRRREELNLTRKAVIEGYRKMHGQKRGVNERLNMTRVVMT